MANQHTTTFPERFWSKIEKTNSCWFWKAATNKFGYGEIFYNKKVWKAHRLSYFIAFGDFDTKLYVAHHCDNPTCVNPDHLFLATQKENVVDMVAKGRHGAGAGLLISYDEWLSIRPKKGKKDICKRGHKFSDKNTRIKKIKSRYARICRTCQSETARADLVRYKVSGFVRKVENRKEVIDRIVDKVYSIGVRCMYCGGDFECLDHEIPKFLGGEITPENINPSCNSCNQKRKALF